MWHSTQELPADSARWCECSLVAAWQLVHAPFPVACTASCPLAQSAMGLPSSDGLCITWQEKQVIVRRASAPAFLKHGESSRPLYSRPVARTIPSDQNTSRTKPASAASSAFMAGESR